MYLPIWNRWRIILWEGFLPRMLSSICRRENYSDSLQLCFDKLQYHKYLVLETPNPRSLYMLSQIFYQDLSHQRPLDLNAVYSMLTAVGFQDIQTEGKAPFPQGDLHGQRLQNLS